jgi:hypothetical protein
MAFRRRKGRFETPWTVEGGVSQWQRKSSLVEEMLLLSRKWAETTQISVRDSTLSTSYILKW